MRLRLPAAIFAESVPIVLYSAVLTYTSIYADGIHASYENGVLTLVLPKKEAVPNKSRHLEIH